MLSKRQTEIFKLIVEEYIKTAKPIGSNQLCEILNCSSATIRNEMVVLEELGLLSKTHTSSGRIPNEKGYRYYVDNIMLENELDKDTVNQLEPIFLDNQLQITDTIDKSLEIVAKLTNCTSIILGDSIATNKLQKVEVVPIMNNQLLGIFITDKGYIEHHRLEIESFDSNEIKQTVELINKLLEGVYVSDIIEQLETKVKPIIANYIEQHHAIYHAFYNAFRDFNIKDSSVKFLGKSNIINQPEFNNIEKIRNIIEKLEGENIVREISEESNGIKIYIGKENEIDEDVTVIKTKYNAGNVSGTIAIIGPKRMEYNKIVKMLDYIKTMIKEKEM